MSEAPTGRFGYYGTDALMFHPYATWSLKCFSAASGYRDCRIVLQEEIRAESPVPFLKKMGMKSINYRAYQRRFPIESMDSGDLFILERTVPEILYVQLFKYRTENKTDYMWIGAGDRESRMGVQFSRLGIDGEIRCLNLPSPSPRYIALEVHPDSRSDRKWMRYSYVLKGKTTGGMSCQLVLRPPLENDPLMIMQDSGRPLYLSAAADFQEGNIVFQSLSVLDEQGKEVDEVSLERPIR